jgi:hypothetical protein
MHQIGQYNPATGASYTVSLPSAFSTTGGLTFIPAGYPNAGTLPVSSFSYGDIYAMSLIPTGNGFYDLGPATLYANMPGSGTEGMEFVASGPLAGHLLVAGYSNGRIDAVAINAQTGIPVGGPSTPSVRRSCRVASPGWRGSPSIPSPGTCSCRATRPPGSIAWTGCRRSTRSRPTIPRCRSAAASP